MYYRELRLFAGSSPYCHMKGAVHFSIVSEAKWRLLNASWRKAIYGAHNRLSTAAGDERHIGPNEWRSNNPREGFWLNGLLRRASANMLPVLPDIPIW